MRGGKEMRSVASEDKMRERLNQHKNINWLRSQGIPERAEEEKRKGKEAERKKRRNEEGGERKRAYQHETQLSRICQRGRR